MARTPYLLWFHQVQLRSACRQGPHFGPARMGLLQQPHRLAIGAQFGQASRMRPGSQGLHPSCLQRETAAGATPTRRSTPRTPLPCRNNLAPIIRRISSASALPLVVMVQITSTHHYYRNTTVNSAEIYCLAEEAFRALREQGGPVCRSNHQSLPSGEDQAQAASHP